MNVLMLPECPISQKQALNHENVVTEETAGAHSYEMAHLEFAESSVSWPINTIETHHWFFIELIYRIKKIGIRKPVE